MIVMNSSESIFNMLLGGFKHMHYSNSNRALRQKFGGQLCTVDPRYGKRNSGRQASVSHSRNCVTGSISFNMAVYPEPQ